MINNLKITLKIKAKIKLAYKKKTQKKIIYNLYMDKYPQTKTLKKKMIIIILDKNHLKYIFI